MLLTPVTLSIARTLGSRPLPYLISQILASNIGGTATLIGDPPNILIGSAAGLDFGAFLFNLAPVVVVILGAFLGDHAARVRGNAARTTPTGSTSWPRRPGGGDHGPAADDPGADRPRR